MPRPYDRRCASCTPSTLIPRAARMAAIGATDFGRVRFFIARSGKKFLIFSAARNGDAARGGAWNENACR